MKIKDNIHLLESTKGAFVYIIRAEQTVIIDTGFAWAGKRMLRELSSLGIELSEIKHILLTHHDVDHTGNAAMLQQLSGAQVWASAEDMPYITGQKECDGFKRYIRRISRTKKPQSIQPYPLGEKIAGIDALPTPGHTPGHVCLLFEDVLFAGDLVENKKGEMLPYPPPWNWDDKLMLESYEKMKLVPHKWVCPSHARPVNQPIR